MVRRARAVLADVGDRSTLRFGEPPQAGCRATEHARGQLLPRFADSNIVGILLRVFLLRHRYVGNKRDVAYAFVVVVIGRARTPDPEPDGEWDARVPVLEAHKFSLGHHRR